MAQSKLVTECFVSALGEKSSMNVDLVTSLLIKLGKEKCMDPGEFLVDAGVLTRRPQPGEGGARGRPRQGEVRRTREREVAAERREEGGGGQHAAEGGGKEEKGNDKEEEGEKKEAGDKKEEDKGAADTAPGGDDEEKVEQAEQQEAASEGNGKWGRYGGGGMRFPPTEIGEVSAAELTHMCRAMGEVERDEGDGDNHQHEGPYQGPPAYQWHQGGPPLHGPLPYNPQHYHLLPVRPLETSYGGAGDYVDEGGYGYRPPATYRGRGRNIPQDYYNSRGGGQRGAPRMSGPYRPRLSRSDSLPLEGVASDTGGGGDRGMMYMSSKYHVGRGASMRSRAGYRGGRGAMMAGYPRVMAMPAPRYYNYKNIRY